MERPLLNLLLGLNNINTCVALGIMTSGEATALTEHLIQNYLKTQTQSGTLLCEMI